MSETEEEAQRREWLESRVKELEQQNKLLEDNLARTESSAAAAAEDAARRGVSSNPADEEGRTRRAGDTAADGGGAAASVYNSGTVGELGTRNPRRESFGFSGTPISSWARAPEPPPKFPPSSKPESKMSWLKRLEVHLQREELGHVLDERAPLIPVNGGGDRVVLDSRYSKGAVAAHLRAFSILQSAVVNARLSRGYKPARRSRQHGR